jgi:uncharacterized membrane protein YedE/YeeE
MLLTDTHFLVVFNLLAGAILGYILYRSDFCMAGIFRDVFLFRQYALLRPLVLLIVLTMVLFSLARLAGLILVPRPPFFSYPSGATLTGGLLFGIGMVLAGGCAVSTIYKMAGGNLASMTAFIGMIAGSMFYAEIHHRWEPVKKASVFVRSIMLPDISPKGYFLAVAVAAIMFCLAFGMRTGRGRWTMTAYAHSYLQPWKAVVALAVLNTAAYILSGWPLSIMTGYAKLGAYVENTFAPAHVAGLPFFNTESISLVLSGVPITGGAAPGEDIVLLTQIPLLVGVIAGAFFTAVRLREFRIYGFPPGRQLASAVAGGVLMGLGTRMAGGCNVTYVMGALPLFAFQGFLFVPAMTLGSYLGVRLLRRFVFP